MLGDTVVVDEAPTRLVQRRHEASVVVEGRQHQGVVFTVDLEDCLHVDLGILLKCGRMEAIRRLKGRMHQYLT